MQWKGPGRGEESRMQERGGKLRGGGERERSVPCDYVLCTLYFGGFGGRCAVILAGTRG